MGDGYNATYGKHMKRLSAYIAEIKGMADKGIDVSDIVPCSAKEYTSYLEMVERKHRFIHEQSDVLRIVPMLSEVECSYGELDMSIRHAEYLLGVKFAPDYRDLLSRFGEVRYRYGSIYGVISVMNVTMRLRQSYEACRVHKQYYAVDCDGGLMFLQGSDGQVFAAGEDGEFAPYCLGLANLVKMREFGVRTEAGLAK